MSCNPAHAAWFEQVCTSLRAAERLQMLTLEADGSRLAMKCNFLADDGALCFKIAHQEEYSRHSPGVLLEVDTVHHFHEDGRLQWMDSCADPVNAMINGLWPDRRRLATVVLPAHRWLGHAATPLRHIPSRRHRSAIR